MAAIRYCRVLNRGERVEHEWTEEYAVQFCALCGEPRAHQHRWYDYGSSPRNPAALPHYVCTEGNCSAHWLPGEPEPPYYEER